MNAIDNKGLTFWESSYKSAGIRGLWGPKHVPFIEGLKLRLKKEGVVKLLDAPCGEGRNLCHFSNYIPLVFGLDSSRAALATLNHRLEQDQIRNCVLMEGNVFKTPFTDCQFDTVFCWDLLGHLKEARSATLELFRLCRNGGLFIGSVFAMTDPARGVGMERVGNEEYMYGPECFFKFYSEGAVRELLSPFAGSRIELELAIWTEEPHPGYREYAHEHQSWCFIITK